ncbi:MAG: hypothetical protein H7Y17_10805 [Chlorobia bacterium]|nr:hypothetical protein [Fimbriimonadaceae bacterium]
MSERVWAGCYIAICLGVGGWVYMMGLIALGSAPLLFVSLLVLAPLSVCWLFFYLLRQEGILRPWHTALVICVTAVTYPLYMQPWNPRNIFVATLEGLTGKTLTEATREMSSYIANDVSVAEEQFVPEDVWRQGVTHQTSYRWNETDGNYNADIGQIFLRDGVVVATRFLPD